jgi:DNA-directed RNA polymerase subunit beta'
LVPLDGGRFATSDLNDLYRRVIIRNNRLKRLIDIKAPEVILRNEKRMLQEAVDSLFDNSRKVNAVRSDGNRALKSLSDMLKGKQGRFRQNLLGKRVDYSGRSVIVVGPELKLHECGLPKDMAAELFKPFIIRKLIERGIVKTVKSAKKIVDRKDPVIWDILENVLKGHPVLLNRAPTLHRLGIQAFQPKLIEGKAIQLHPLVCTAFNADFDGDQMAVHVPLGQEAILEASMLMLSSHNILNPANGAPITVPSQDMVLGLYYLTKGRKNTAEHPIIGEGRRYYSPDEVIIAFNEGKLSKHAIIKVRVNMKDKKTGEMVTKVIETVAGRVIFNQFVPDEVGFVDELLTKKKLQTIIADIFKEAGQSKAAKFLDDIKDLGFQMAYKGGLSMGLNDVKVPDEKQKLVANAQEEVEGVWNNYMMGLITDNERYNQVIDIWTRTNTLLTNTLMKQLEEDQQGFNSIYMMMHSGARGSREQIRQLGGMRGLMAKPQKNLAGSVGSIIENPILSNFKEGLDVLEYFISTHGARKGLADTALKTADAGYLTRRLVDVAQDLVVTEEDCGTLRGLKVTALKDNEDIVEPLSERILGRVTVHAIYDPLTDELICEANEEITDELAKHIEETNIEEVEIRSLLTCESRIGGCAKCYGRNLSTGKMVQAGEAVGVIAAQSIGEPGTQLTLRTFHVGGTASNIAVEANIKAKFSGVLEFEAIRVIETTQRDGRPVKVVMGRTGEIRIVDKEKNRVLITNHVPYGAFINVKDGQQVEKGDELCFWDPYNAVILSEFDGSIEYEAIIEGVTYKEESDEQTGHREKVITDTRDKTKNPAIIVNGKNETKGYNIPVGAHLAVDNKEKIKAGQVLAKIPRTMGKSRDITGGLPRVTELFEARNPSNPAVVSEIDGVVTYGGIKRGNREIFIESRDGVQKRYLVPLSKHILVQDNDFVRAGQPLSDGSITPSDILSIKGPTAVQEYLVNEIQEVYRLQGVKINDKHIEAIVSQMMQKVEIIDPGDTSFLTNEYVDKLQFREDNDTILDKKVVIEAGDSPTMRPGQIITSREFRDENSVLRRKDQKLVEVRDAMPAVSRPTLQGITQASLKTESWLSAASFQETTKVLSEAAIRGKTDWLMGLKENVIVGHLIPAGTGQRKFNDIIVTHKDEYDETTMSIERARDREKELQD